MIGSSGLGDEAIVSLVVDANPTRAGADAVVSHAERILRALRGVTAAAGETNRAFEVAGRGIGDSADKQARFIERIERQLNPLSAAVKGATRDLNDLIEVMRSGGAHAAAAAEAIGGQVQHLRNLRQELAQSTQLYKEFNDQVQKSIQAGSQHFSMILDARAQQVQANNQQRINQYTNVRTTASGATDTSVKPELDQLRIAMQGRAADADAADAASKKKIAAINAENAALDREILELDKLRSKYDQNFRALQVYEAGFAELLKLEQAGIQVHGGNAAALDRLAAAMNAATIEGQALAAMEREAAITAEKLKTAKMEEAAALEQTRQAVDQDYRAKVVYNAEVAKLNALAAAGIPITGGYTAQYQRLAAEMEKSIVASQKLALQQRELSEAARKAAAEEKQLASATSQFLSVVAPAAVIDQRHNEILNEGWQLLQKKRITQEQYNAALAMPKERLVGMNAAMQQTGETSKALRFAMANLSFQVNDVVSGFAMGQSAFQIFAQQAGQIIQIFQQVGFKAMFEGIKGAIASVLSPLGIFIGLVGLAAVAFAIIANRALTNKQMLKEFENALSGIDSSTVTTSKDLLTLSYDLRAVGLSADEANKSIQLLSRNMSVNLLNPNAVRQVSQLGLDVGAKLGIGDVAGVERVNQAINGSTEALVKLGLETKSISEDQAAWALGQAALGNRLRTNNTLLAEMAAVLKGKQQEMKSGWAQFTDAIAAGWNAIINKIADSSAFAGIDALFKRMADNLKYIIDNGKFNPDSNMGRLSAAANNGWNPAWGERPANADKVLIDLTNVIDRLTNWLSFSQAKKGEADVYTASPTLGDYSIIRTPGLKTGGPLIPPVSNDVVPGTSVRANPSVMLSALRAANINSKNIDDLEIGLAIQLNAFFANEKLIGDAIQPYIQSASRFGAHPNRFNPSGIGLHNADVLGVAMAADIGNLTAASAGRLASFDLGQPVPGDFPHVERRSLIPSASAATGPARMDAAARYIAGRSRAAGGITGPVLPGGSAGTDLPGVSPDLSQSNDLLRLGRDLLAAYSSQLQIKNRLASEDVELSKKRAIDLATETARLETNRAELGKGTEAGQASKLANIEADKARQLGLISLQKESEITDMRNKGTFTEAEAARVNMTAAIQQEAVSKATIRAKETQISFEIAYREEIQATANEAFKGVTMQLAAQKPVLEGQQRLAEAAKLGATAEVQARQEIEAKAIAQKLLDVQNIKSSGITKELTDSVMAQARAMVVAKDAAAASTAVTRQLNQQADARMLIQAQIGMQGQTPELMSARLAVIQKMMELQRDTTITGKEQRQQVLDSVIATQNWTIALAEAQRATQRLEDLFKSIADTITNSIVSAMNDAFDGKKAESWGKRMKDVLKSVVTGISTNMFLRPLTGTIAQALGMGNLAAQYGTFGGGSAAGLVGSGLGLIGGTGGGQGTITGTVGGQPATFNINTGGGFNALSGLGKELGLTDSAGTFGTSGIFGPTGSLSGVGDFFSGGAGGIFAHTPDAASFAAGSGPVLSAPGSIFGTTTIGTGLSAVGAGFGAGMLTNSLIGGNQTGGMIGSAVGSIAGMALGSMIGMPFLGAILGGAASGALGGMFGNSRPRNASAGGNIDLTTGRVTGTFLGGDQQIDQSTKSAVSSIGQFTRDILKVTGGTLSGNVLFQGGKNTGFTADSTLPQFQGRFELGKDAEEATRLVELALVRSVKGLSNTAQIVVNTLDDPALIAQGLAFAKVYDNLKKAADSAFSGISSDTEALGPYAQALEQLKTTFDDLTDQANSFGLSLDPIIAGRAEANIRLTKDFDKAVQMEISGSKDRVNALLDAEKVLGEARIKDAEAVGGNLVKVLELNSINLGRLYAQLGDAANGLGAGLIENAKLLGPYETALNQINATYERLIKTANEAGDSTEQLVKDQKQVITTLTVDFNKSITDQIQAIKDPVAALIDIEKRAGEIRLQDARKIGGDIIAVQELNNLRLMALYEQQAQSINSSFQGIIDLKKELQSGELSGRVINDRIAAGTAEYQSALTKVRGGDMTAINDLLKFAQSSIELQIQATGQDVTTSRFRAQLIADFNEVLTSKGFAGGTSSTPPGLIQVHKDEWISQPGGLSVIPRQMASDMSNMVTAIQDANNLGDTTRVVQQGVFSQAGQQAIPPQMLQDMNSMIAATTGEGAGNISPSRQMTRDMNSMLRATTRATNDNITRRGLAPNEYTVPNNGQAQTFAGLDQLTEEVKLLRSENAALQRSNAQTSVEIGELTTTLLTKQLRATEDLKPAHTPMRNVV